MELRVKVMQEGEVVRQLNASTVVAEEGQVMLSMEESTSATMGVALLDPETANALAIQLSQAAHSGSTLAWLHRRKHGIVSSKGVLGPTPDANPLPKVTLWSVLFGVRK